MAGGWQQQYDANKRNIALQSMLQIRGKQTPQQTAANLRQAGVRNAQPFVPGSQWGLLSTANDLLGGLTGARPSDLAKGLYAWRHPVAQYQRAQRSTTPSYGMMPLGAGKFKIIDEFNSNAPTRWAAELSGQQETVGSARRMMGPEALAKNGQMFHLHALDDQGNLVGAMHGYGHAGGIHIVSARVAAKHAGAAMQLFNKVVAHADKHGLPISGDLMNPKLEPLLTRWARNTGRTVTKDNSARVTFHPPHK